MTGVYRKADIKSILDQELQDDEFREAYDQVKATYDLIEQIITIRKSKNVTQAQLAQRAHLSQQAISRLEKEKHIPNTQTLLKILNALDVSIHLVNQD